MRFRHAGQGGRPPPTLSCYGKLPCYGDFLQIGIDSPAGRWMVETLDTAHDAIAASGARIDAERELRILLWLAEMPDIAIAALVRPSSDAHGRRYPVVVAAHLEAAEWVAEPHLAPLCAAPLWSSLARHVIENPGRSRDELMQRLRTLPDRADEPTYSRQRFERLAHAPLPDPWGQLVGAAAPSTGGRAALPAERPTIWCLPAQAGALAVLAGPADLAAVWLRLWAATAGRTLPWVAAIEVWHGAGPSWQLWTLFEHPPTGQELAALLCPAAPDKAGHTLPAFGSVAPAVAGSLESAGAGCLADLWSAA